MSQQVRAFARASLWALPVWAALLFFGTYTHQPDPLTDFLGWSSYVTTDTFLWSHLIASILGAAIGTVGVVGLMLYLLDTRAAGRAITGTVATVLGNTLTTAIFGVAAFAQPAMGRLFLAGQQNAREFYNQTYGVPLFGAAILSLLTMIVGAVFVGMAIAASGRLPRWAGWAYAIALVGFVVSAIIIPVGQSVTSAVLFIATTAVALRATQAERRPELQTPVAAER